MPRSFTSLAKVGWRIGDGVTVGWEIRSNFFDRPAVQQQIGKKRTRALSRIGAFIRQAARSSLRRRKKPSKPGKPPSVHSKDRFATLKNVLFGLEPGGMSVVVGPVKVGKQSPTAPAMHEHGDVLMMLQRRWKGDRPKPKKKKAKSGRARTAPPKPKRRRRGGRVRPAPKPSTKKPRRAPRRKGKGKRAFTGWYSVGPVGLFSKKPNRGVAFEYRKRIVRFRKRPFMRPALRLVIKTGKMPKAFK